MRVHCGSYDGLQGTGNQDYWAVATQGVSKQNPCWRGWRPAGGRGKCVYTCHRALESTGVRRLRADRGTVRRTDASDFYYKIIMSSAYVAVFVNIALSETKLCHLLL